MVEEGKKAESSDSRGVWGAFVQNDTWWRGDAFHKVARVGVSVASSTPKNPVEPKNPTSTQRRSLENTERLTTGGFIRLVASQINPISLFGKWHVEVWSDNLSNIYIKRYIFLKGSSVSELVLLARFQMDIWNIVLVHCSLRTSHLTCQIWVFFPLFSHERKKFAKDKQTNDMKTEKKKKCWGNILLTKVETIWVLWNYYLETVLLPLQFLQQWN